MDLRTRMASLAPSSVAFGPSPAPFGVAINPDHLSLPCVETQSRVCPKPGFELLRKQANRVRERTLLKHEGYQAKHFMKSSFHLSHLRKQVRFLDVFFEMCSKFRFLALVSGPGEPKIASRASCIIRVTEFFR